MITITIATGIFYILIQIAVIYLMIITLAVQCSVASHLYVCTCKAGLIKEAGEATGIVVPSPPEKRIPTAYNHKWWI